MALFLLIGKEGGLRYAWKNWVSLKLFISRHEVFMKEFDPRVNLDIEQFWKDDALAHEENCFSSRSPQVALGIRMAEECIYAELGIPGHQWSSLSRELRLEYNKRYNDRAEEIVGKRLLLEDLPPPDAAFPPYRRIGEVFGGRYEIKDHVEWLHSDISTPEGLEKQLDFVETINLREFALPPEWEKEKKRIFETYGKKPPLFTMLRGPCTLATSIYGVENLSYLFFDEPELFERFGRTILHVIMEYISLFRDEAGYTEETLPRGFTFKDDDCAMMTPEMYEVLGYPVLKAVFDRVSPGVEDYRYQHSDSDMGHLLPQLARLNLTVCNFGPHITVREIRRHMPKTRIDGQLAPLVFMRNDIDEIVRQVKRDCEMARENNGRGLNLRTAGSISNGSLLSSMRVVMAVIQEFGRY
jgi:uroporphyrinogen decarboxylase